jgi:hypothetical protein
MALIIPNSFASRTSAQLSDLDENFDYLKTELDPYIDNIKIGSNGDVGIGTAANYYAGYKTLTIGELNTTDGVVELLSSTGKYNYLLADGNNLRLSVGGTGNIILEGDSGVYATINNTGITANLTSQNELKAPGITSIDNSLQIKFNTTLQICTQLRMKLYKLYKTIQNYTKLF